MPTQDEAYIDFQKDKVNQLGDMYCYCYQQFSKVGLKVSDIEFEMDPEKYKYCKDWFESYSLTNIMIGVMALAIVMINFVLKRILKMLAQFERRPTKTEEISASTIKMFIAQFINMGVIIILVNADINFTDLPSNFPILQGEYPDFNIEWYKNIGSTIALTMILSVFTPHLAAMGFVCIRGSKRCCDRGCRCDKRHTKKVLQEDYDELYIGPEMLMDFRYSQILTNIFVTFIYSTGMPILYLICLGSLILTFWIDKFLFINVYKKPPRYDMALMRNVRGLLKYAVFLHFAVGFYMVSNTSILTYNGDFTFLSGFKEQVEKTNSYLKENEYIYPERLVTTHCLIYLFGMVALLALEILLKICRSPLHGLYTCFCCLFRIKNPIFSNDLYEELHITDVKREYLKSKNELHDYESIIGNREKALFIEDSLWSRHTTKALKEKLEFMKAF